MYDFDVILPMAGKGSRFLAEGIVIPKPMITVAGKMLVQHALECIPGVSVRRLALVVSPALHDFAEQSLGSGFGSGGFGRRMLPPDWEHVHVDVYKEPVQTGQATSVYYGLKSWAADTRDRSDRPVIVLNCDQMFDWESCAERMYDIVLDRVKCFVPTFESKPVSEHKKWSYVLPARDFCGNQLVHLHSIDGVIEKPDSPLSEGQPIIGVFAFSSTEYLKTLLEKYIPFAPKINGEYYLAPAINSIVSVMKGSWQAVPAFGIGTPGDIDVFAEDLGDHAWRANNSKLPGNVST